MKIKYLIRLAIYFQQNFVILIWAIRTGRKNFDLSVRKELNFFISQEKYETQPSKVKMTFLFSNKCRDLLQLSPNQGF